MQEGDHHFVSICDHGFLAFAITMFESLLEHLPNCKCYLVCMDDRAYEHLRSGGPDWITPIPLDQIEYPELLEKKKGRTAREYCWTLSSHAFGAVKNISPEAESITYVDADLYFLRSPIELFEELDESNKSILITDHHYAPEYDATERSGRFCVQYLTALNHPSAWLVIDEWKSQCLEWCHARLEDGKFGDQKYLEDWPDKHGQVVHVANPPERFLAPWNADMISRSNTAAEPILYHFQGARYIGKNKIVLGINHKIPSNVRGVFKEYGNRLAKNIQLLESEGINTTVFPLGKRGPHWYRKWTRILRQNLILHEW